MKSVEVIDRYEKIREYFSAHQDQFKRFISTKIEPDPILNKLWKFISSRNPPGSIDYPIEHKIEESKSIDTDDIEHLYDKIKPESFSSDDIFYELIALSAIPLYYAIRKVLESPELKIEEYLEHISQELTINTLHDGEVIKSQTVSFAQLSNGAIVHTVTNDQEVMCLEVDDHKVSWNMIRGLDNYSFRAFQRRRNPGDEDILWGEGKKEYIIKIPIWDPEAKDDDDKRKFKTFPFPIFNKTAGFINKILKSHPFKDRASVEDTILGVEQETHKHTSSSKNITQAMRRRLFYGALSFKGDAWWSRYFKPILSGDDDFKKASTPTTIIEHDHNGIEKEKRTRELRRKFERSEKFLDTYTSMVPEAQDIESLVVLQELIDIMDDDSKEFVATLLKDSTSGEIESLIALSEKMDHLDNTQKTIIRYRYEGLSQAEIAQELGINQSTVSRHIKEIKKIISSPA